VDATDAAKDTFSAPGPATEADGVPAVPTGRPIAVMDVGNERPPTPTRFDAA